jgi:hypothetical protein
MQPTLHRGYILRLSISTFKSAAVCVLLSSTLALAQDSPSRFEAGSNFTAVHLGRMAFFGPSVEEDINFGRHIGPDTAYSWLPTSPSRLTGLFGAKVGTRTKRFGFFGKVRSGFISIGNTLREETFMFGPGPADFTSTVRFARLTKRALDFGGVMEYNPTRQWDLRWNFGDTVVFGEPESILHMITVDSGVSPILPFLATPGRTSKNFQFSTTIRYRF